MQCTVPLLSDGPDSEGVGGAAGGMEAITAQLLL